MVTFSTPFPNGCQCHICKAVMDRTKCLTWMQASLKLICSEAPFSCPRGTQCYKRRNQPGFFGLGEGEPTFDAPPQPASAPPWFTNAKKTTEAQGLRGCTEEEPGPVPIKNLFVDTEHGRGLNSKVPSWVFKSSRDQSTKERKDRLQPRVFFPKNQQGAVR